MVLLSWGIGIAFPSRCRAAVSARDPLILLFISVRLGFAHPRAAGGDVQASFGEGEGQQLFLQ